MAWVLGGAVGGYWERGPHASLVGHFARTWFHVTALNASDPLVVVPDGYADLQWVDGVLRIAGPDRTVRTEPIAAGAIVVGLRFQPAAIPQWLGAPASEFVNARVP